MSVKPPPVDVAEDAEIVEEKAEDLVPVRIVAIDLPLWEIWKLTLQVMAISVPFLMFVLFIVVAFNTMIQILF